MSRSTSFADKSADPRDLCILGVALLGASSAPPLMAVIAAPAVAIAFWRNLMALPVAVPLALWKGPG